MGAATIVMPSAGAAASTAGTQRVGVVSGSSAASTRRRPIRRTRSAVWARVLSGHIAAELPGNASTWRRRILPPEIPRILEDLLRPGYDAQGRLEIGRAHV